MSVIQTYRLLIKPNSRNFSTTTLKFTVAAAPKENAHHINKTKFARDKLFVSVGTLGAPQHGKTTLTSAITKSLADTHAVPFRDVHDLDQGKGQTVNVKHLEWWTDDFHVAHSDMPGDLTYAKNLFSCLPNLDAAFLVVNADQGVKKETLIQYHTAKHLGIQTILPFVNVTATTDEEVVDLVKMELEESMTEEEMQTLLVGNLSEAHRIGDGIAPLLENLKTKLKLRNRDEEAPFLMQVEQSGDIPSRGIFTAGRITQGVAHVGDTMEVYVSGNTSKVVLRDCEIFRKITPDLRVGDRGGAFIKKVNKVIEIKRGSLLYDPKLVTSDWKANRMWKIELKALPGAGNFTIGGKAILFHRGNNESATLSNAMVTAKYPASVEVTLKQEILAKVGDPIVVRVGPTDFFIGHLTESM